MRKKCLPIIVVLFGLFLCIWCNDGLCASDRVALVIGNQDYQDAPLKNPVNDANDLSEALHQLGFTVITKINVTHREMERSLREFKQKITPNSVALFYFSGHGVQMNGKNYLLPVGQTIYGPEEIRFKSVQADFVLAKMESAGSKVNIVVLDACRNNPSKGIRGTGQGLAAMDAEGAFIAYSTGPGSFALDNARERNGLYTKNLLKTLKTPGLQIEELFRRVRYKVSKESDKKQVPWTASGLYGEKPFYFIPPQENPDPNTAKKTKIGKYIDNHNGTITDTETGLMWKRCSEGLSGKDCEKGKVKEYEWDEAMQRFKNVDYAGYSDWRMPTIEELKTLVYCSKGVKDKKSGMCNYGSTKPTINHQAFPNTPQLVWSGSPNALDSVNAWSVYFFSGYSSAFNRNHNLAVRLVRGGQ